MNDKDKNKLLEVFGTHLRKIRKNKGISIREMELEGDIDRRRLSKIENGKANPTLFTLRKICDVLGITLEELFTGLK